MPKSLKEKFISTLETHSMLKRGDKVMIALSGGVDSTVMTCLFKEIEDEYDLTLYVFHLNHKLRGEESDTEAAFVKALSDELGLKSFIKDIDVKKHAAESKLSLQVAARRLRYELLYELAAEYEIDKIATAHNSDDRVETVLLRLIRGTAGANIAGIPPVRDGRIIRPLIDIARDDIEEYAREKGIKYMTDSSNLSTKYLRNRVRLELIPHLAAEYNENIKESILNYSRVARLENDFINENVKVKYEECLIHSDSEAMTFSIERLRKVKEALLNRIITSAYYELAPYGETLSYSHVEKLKYFMNSEKPNLSYNLPGGVTASKSYDKLTFSSSDTLTLPDYEYTHTIGDTTEISGSAALTSAYVLSDTPLELLNEKSERDEFLDADTLTYPITVRNFRPGDVIRPLNMAGTKKLKDIFIDKKLPIPYRQSVPVLVSKDEIVLVHGVCVSDDHKVTERTLKAVKFTVLPLRAIR